MTGVGFLVAPCNSGSLSPTARSRLNKRRLLNLAGRSEDPGHHESHRIPCRRRPCRTARSARRHLHEQGRRGNARACSGAARVGLRSDVGVDVPRALCTSAPPRSARYWSLTRFRHLRLVRPAGGGQAGAQGTAHRRQLRAAPRGAVADQPRQEPDGRPGGTGRGGRLEPARRADRQGLSYYGIPQDSLRLISRPALKTSICSNNHRPSERNTRQFRFVMVDGIRHEPPAVLAHPAAGRIHRTVRRRGSGSVIYNGAGPISATFSIERDFQRRPSSSSSVTTARRRLLDAHRRSSARPQPQGEEPRTDRKGGARIVYIPRQDDRGGSGFSCARLARAWRDVSDGRRSFGPTLSRERSKTRSCGGLPQDVGGVRFYERKGSRTRWLTCGGHHPPTSQSAPRDQRPARASQGVMEAVETIGPAAADDCRARGGPPADLAANSFWARIVHGLEKKAFPVALPVACRVPRPDCQPHRGGSAVPFHREGRCDRSGYLRICGRIEARTRSAYRKLAELVSPRASTKPANRSLR